MSDFTDYNDARESIQKMIDNKKNEINELNNEIYSLRETRRMMDHEFEKRKLQKPVHIG